MYVYSMEDGSRESLPLPNVSNRARVCSYPYHFGNWLGSNSPSWWFLRTSTLHYVSDKKISVRNVCAKLKLYFDQEFLQDFNVGIVLYVHVPVSCSWTRSVIWFSFLLHNQYIYKNCYDMETLLQLFACDYMWVDLSLLDKFSSKLLKMIKKYEIFKFNKIQRSQTFLKPSSILCHITFSHDRGRITTLYALFSMLYSLIIFHIA